MDNQKKIAIIGIVGLPANYGGFETLVNYLTLNLNTRFSLTVYCQRVPKNKRLRHYNGSNLVYSPFKANGAQGIIYDIISIIKSWFCYDTLLILGTAGCIILPFLNLFKKTRTVVNFGGLEWKREKWNYLIRSYLKFTEKIAIKYSTVVVADNQFFCDYIEQEYKKKSVLIEYGGDHTAHLKPTSELINKYPFLNFPYDISVSRAQPDNNLHLVLEAYKNTPQRTIVLISNYESFQYGRELKRSYASFTNIIMQDAIYDLNELDTIRSNAHLYIHSHSFCGTAPSLVEAMSLGLPLIVYDTETNRFTTEGHALYFNNSVDLSNILQLINNSEIEVMKENMLKISGKRYTWDRISKLYAKVL